MLIAVSRALALILGVLCAVAAISHAQPAFEIAWLKPSPPANGPTYNANMGKIDHGTLTMTNVTLCDCVRFAYSIPNDFQIEGPDWIKNKEIRFHITAKADPDTPRDQVLVMLQTLLVERFHMTIHHEQRRLGYLALLPGKGPSKGSGGWALYDLPRTVAGRPLGKRSTHDAMAGTAHRAKREPHRRPRAGGGHFAPSLHPALTTAESLGGGPPPSGNTAPTPPARGSRWPACTRRVRAGREPKALREIINLP